MKQKALCKILLALALILTGSDEHVVFGQLQKESGIKEIVPREYAARYQLWKQEVLKTEYGRTLWERYSKNEDFTLRIVVSGDRKYGAGTDDYEWNSPGELISATIRLGKDLDKGFPDPIYYPVMNSLSGGTETAQISGSILASAKFVHELGHVEQTEKANGKVYRQQNKLISSYYNIFLTNGHDTGDPRLVELVNELGARPIEIWEDREYWSEVSAMRFLLERLDKDNFYCGMIKRIRRNLDTYALGYSARFTDVTESDQNSPCSE